MARPCGHGASVRTHPSVRADAKTRPPGRARAFAQIWDVCADAPQCPRGHGRPCGRTHSLPPLPCGRSLLSARTREKIKKIKNILFLIFFRSCCRLGKIYNFHSSIPKIPQLPELRGLRGRSCEKKKVFSA
jgi:hypothetical protein